MSDGNPIQEFIDSMRSAGIDPADISQIVANDKVNRLREKGDKGRKTSVTYQVDVTDGFGYGWYRSHKEGITHNWNSKSKQEFTEQERQDWRKKVDAKRKAADKKRKREAFAAAAAARDLYNAAAPAPADHDYLKRKRIVNIAGVKIGKKGELLIRVIRDKTVINVQRIYPDGSKYFLEDAETKGGYYPIFSGTESMNTIVICEGYSTGDAVRQATGLPVVVAFNAGNLKPVCDGLRLKFPNSTLIIAADNDQWTAKPIENPGLHYARQAANKSRGHALWPDFPEDHPEKPTDFNDKLMLDGKDSIKDLFSEFMKGLQSRVLVKQTQNKMPVDDDSAPVEEDFEGLPFKVLGFDRDNYYYFSYERKDIVILKAGQHNSSHLKKIVSDWGKWELFANNNDPNAIRQNKLSNGSIADFAETQMMNLAHKRGVFDPNNTRGVGVWEDAGRTVVHCGDKLYVDGAALGFNQMESADYVYIARSNKIGAPTQALDDISSRRLAEVCRKINWKESTSGLLLSGWMVVSQVCAILNWRPHIWICGEASCGKTTVIEKLMQPAIGKIGFYLLGKTTEPGIRKHLDVDARPVILDEAEKNMGSSIESIIDLARASSARTHSAGLQNFDGFFQPKFAMCFSSVNESIHNYADQTRISLLQISKSDEAATIDRFHEFELEIDDLIDGTFSARLMGRTLGNIDTLRKNIITFKRAALRILRDARAADQISAMVAGHYLLLTTDEVSDEDAFELLSKYDWSPFIASEENREQYVLLRYILTRPVRHTESGGTTEVMISSLVKVASGFGVIEGLSLSKDKAAYTLSKYGMKATREHLHFFKGNHPGMRDLLKYETQWRESFITQIERLDFSTDKRDVDFLDLGRRASVAVPLVNILSAPETQIPLIKEEEYQL